MMLLPSVSMSAQSSLNAEGMFMPQHLPPQPNMNPNHNASIQNPTNVTLMCSACKRPIYDKFVSNVLDCSWHAACVQCADCKTTLSDKCYTRNGHIYCKDDFLKRFGTRCTGCSQSIGAQDLVRRARDKVFHVQCFRCSQCTKLLDTGEQLYIVNGNTFLCKHDYFAQNNNLQSAPGASSGMQHGDCGSEAEEDDLPVSTPGAMKTDLDMHLFADLSPQMHTPTGPNGTPRPSSDSSHDSPDKIAESNHHSADENSSGQSGAKRRGPRTTIKAKQLDTLKAAFTATPKPTRHIREQLAQETGLNMRVIQVWFQNRRSKERRMKQLRFGGMYRAGRRNRAVRPDDPLLVPPMFPAMFDGLAGGPRVPDGSFFAPGPGQAPQQPPLGFYPAPPGDMFGNPADNNNNNNGGPEFAQLGAAPAQFMMPPVTQSIEEPAHSDTESQFLVDDGVSGLRAIAPSPMSMQEDSFQPQYSKHSDVQW